MTDNKDIIPLISIITVCYNSSATIARTLDSVAAQSFADYEYIIVDGGSTDGTLDIVDKYSERFGHRLKVVSEPDNGIYDAMNKGIKMARGRIIGIINSDDYYEQDALSVIASAYHGEAHLVLYGMMRKVDNGREIETVLYHHNNLDNQMIAHPSCFITADVYRDYGVYDTSYKSSADYEFMLRLFHSTDTEFRPVYSVIANFSVGGMSGSETGVRETLKLMKMYGTISDGQYRKKMLKSYIHELMTR